MAALYGNLVPFSDIITEREMDRLKELAGPIVSHCAQNTCIYMCMCIYILLCMYMYMYMYMG